MPFLNDEAAIIYLAAVKYSRESWLADRSSVRLAPHVLILDLLQETNADSLVKFGFWVFI